MLRAMYTPETITKDEFHRHIFMWYARVDVMAGILAGEEAKLGREWYVASERCAFQQQANSPDDFRKKAWLLVTQSGRIGRDMTALFARTSSPNIVNHGELREQSNLLSASLDQLSRDLDSIKDPRYLVKSFPPKAPPGSDDIFDSDEPSELYDEPIWEVNYLSLDVRATILMHKHHTSLVLQQQDQSMSELAKKQCRLIEMMTRWPGRRRELPIAFKACLGISSMFLPPDQAHIMWSCRKLAWLEQRGG